MEELHVDWDKRIILPEEGSRSIRRLYLRKYDPKSKSLKDLPSYPRLHSLRLGVSPIKSFDGIERFKELKYGEFGYLTKLEDLRGLDKLSLDTLEFETCKNVRDWMPLTTLPNLRLLGLFSCGELENLKFIERMPALKRFGFVKTNIKNGDLTPLIRLDSAGFLPKRHYSHTPEELSAAIEERQKKEKEKRSSH